MKSNEIIIVIISVAIGLILIASLEGYLVPFFSSLLDPLWVSVFVTTVLVIINIIYILQNRQSIKEMEKARKANLMPYIRITLAWLGPIVVVLKASNVGKGPATNVKATITFSPSEQTRPWAQSVMQPDEYFRILLPEGNIDRVCEIAAQINIKGSYSDIFGQSFEIGETIDTKEFIDNARQLQPIMEPDLPRLIKEIKDELHGIKNEITRTRS